VTQADPLTTPADLSRSIYRSALRLVFGVWLVTGLGLHVVLAGLRSGLLGWSMYIWLASGLVAALALAPGCRWPKRSQAGPDPGDLLLAVIASIGIRFGGTVALFGLCRYHDGLSAEATAAFVCGWYLLLTCVEVAAVAKQMSALPLLASTPAAAELSVIPTGSSQTSVRE
jgi:hypothetical protein